MKKKSSLKSLLTGSLRLSRSIRFVLAAWMAGILSVATAGTGESPSKPAVDSRERGAPTADGIWAHFGTIMDGGNFDAAVTEDGTLFFFGSESRIIDQNGATLWRDPQGDSAMSWISQAPAVSVDPAGGLHAISRGQGGHRGGFELFYQYRPKDGEWRSAIRIGDKLPRNYCVGVAGIDEELAYIVFSENYDDSPWGRVNFAAVENGEVTNYDPVYGFRIDNILDFRLAGQDRLYLAAGNNSPDGFTFFYTTKIQPTVKQTFDALRNSRLRLKPGSGRRGFPRLFPHADGSVDITMGSQTGMAFWARSQADGALDESDFTPVFDDLGKWHLSVGISAAATLPGTDIVLVAAIRSEGGKSGQGPLVARISYDGGESWQDEMRVTNAVRAGEGRGRVKVMAIDNSFFVAYPGPGSEGTVELSRYTVDLSEIH